MAASANKAKTKKRKAPAHAWKAGQSGNPSGRPKVNLELRASCREMTPIILKRLAEEIGTEDGIPGDDWLEASKVVLAYGWGKPPAADEDREALSQASRPMASISSEALLSIIDMANAKPADPDAD